MPPDLQDLADQLTLPSTAAIGIPLALIAAVLLAIGTQFQHRGVTIVEEKHEGSKTGLNFRQLKALLARPSWVIGTVLLGLAIVLQLTSLTLAPITVVQPLGAVALVVTAIVNARVTKTPLDRVSIRSIAICVLGVGVFVTIAAFVTQSHPVTATQLWTVLIVLSVVLAILITLFLVLRGRTPRPIFYVIAAGTLFGFVVTLAKVVIDRVRTIIITDFEIDAADILTLLCIVGLVAASLLGLYFVQTAHSTNPPDLVVAGLTVIDPLVAVAIGIVVLGEAAGAPWWAIVGFVAAGATAIYGVISLSRHHPQSLANTAIVDVVDPSVAER
ncbi:DMT family transporter [Leifsonia sp. H3M29-4]|uniref:DMT family transporter n=1 Tax=Salinibacterium metalliresistens TaxID=3031321 RepID=UPI0023DC9FB1|nr:DMT family transporter [Salinibacterium metalliresistens]MDF1480101.1 DMT family transporter [Salinibacterium metalliresistens]